MEPSPESQFPAPGDTHTTLFGRIVRMNAGTMNPSHTRPLAVRKGDTLPALPCFQARRGTDQWMVSVCGAVKGGMVDRSRYVIPA